LRPISGLIDGTVGASGVFFLAFGAHGERAWPSRRNLVGEIGGASGAVSTHGVGPPGSQAAIKRGCTCSVLANAAYRTGAADTPLIDPDCPVHAARGEVRS
jgi:hypothetical protein